MSDRSVLIQRESFIQKFTKHKLATIAAIIILAEVLFMLITPLVMDLDPLYLDSSALAQGPSETHILGTDDIGRDIFSRLVYGGRISMLVGVLSMIISFVVGVPLGLCAGYFKGKIEFLVMRAIDIFQSFPVFVIILVTVSIFGSSVIELVLIIGIMNWVSPAKIVYGATLSVREKDFIMAEKTMGANHFIMLIRHILPNVISPVWIQIAFRVSSAIILESSLSFLGAGIKAPQASWGNMINAAQNATVLVNQPWIWLPPGIIMLVTTICINLVGEGVRDALDPKMKR